MNTIIKELKSELIAKHEFLEGKYYMLTYTFVDEKRTAFFTIQNEKCFFAKIDQLEIRPDLMSIEHIFNMQKDIEVSFTSAEFFNEFVANFISKFI